MLAARFIYMLERIAFFNQPLRRIAEEEAHEEKADNHACRLRQPGNRNAQRQSENQAVGRRQKNRRENTAGVNQHIKNKADDNRPRPKGAQILYQSVDITTNSQLKGSAEEVLGKAVDT